jgi:hypothetical protein
MTTPNAYNFIPISNAQFNTPKTEQLPTLPTAQNNYVTFIKPSLYIPKKGRVEEKIALIYHFMKDNEAISDHQTNILQTYYQLYQTLEDKNEKDFYFNQALVLLTNIALNASKIERKDKNRIKKELWLNQHSPYRGIMPERQKEILNTCGPIAAAYTLPKAAANPYHPSFIYTTVRIPSKAKTTKISESLLIQQLPTAPQFTIPECKIPPAVQPKFTPIQQQQFTLPSAPIAHSAQKPVLNLLSINSFKQIAPQIPECKNTSNILIPPAVPFIQKAQPDYDFSKVQIIPILKTCKIPKNKSICDLAIEKGAVEEK